MDELILLLIKGIARLIGGPPTTADRRFTKVPQGVTPARPAAARPPAPPRAGPPRRPARRPAATTVAVAAPIITRQATPPAAVAVAAATATKPATAAAANVRRWLTPVALRQQVVLSEILRPPVALRDGA